MSNFLVTGGAGFIGSHLIDRLLQEGNTVVCFDNFDNFYNPMMKWGNVTHHAENPNFKLVSGVVQDVRSFEKAFKGNDIDVVVHLAAQAGVRPSMQNPNLHFEVNVLGTVNMLELCRKYNVDTVLYASSSSVYGNYPETPFKETFKLDEPLCPYAASKKSGELICYTYHHLYSMHISCIRPFTVYGSRQRLEMAIPLFTRLLHANEPLTVHGDGSTRRDYTHVSDVVDGIIRAIEYSRGFQVYNIGTSKVTTLNQLIAYISGCLDIKPDKVRINYVSAGIGEAVQTYACIDKAKDCIGYDPKMDIKDGLKEYIDWFLEEGVKCRIK